MVKAQKRKRQGGGGSPIEHSFNKVDMQTKKNYASFIDPGSLKKSQSMKKFQGKQKILPSDFAQNVIVQEF